ncbi:MAG: NADH-quinone oxidoreductase subunit N [Desulfuromonadaceae bacterium]|nr:NADH-quinone oxidoreductase subunit N [Desulfuromonadaceae bacterium]
MTSGDLMALMPILILVSGSVLCLLVGAVKPGRYLYTAAIVVVSAAFLWSCAVPDAAILPGLSVTPFSRFSAAFLYGTGIISLLLSLSYNSRCGIAGEEYPATILFALAGMGVTCAATDLLMLFLGLEAFTFAFYILVAIKRGSAGGGEAGLKYLLNGTLSAAILAMGIALVYAARGTIKLTELVSTGGGAPEPLFLVGGCLILMGMAFKLSLVPAHLWTADVYQGAPAPVTALLSTSSKGASLAALLLLVPLFGTWHGLHDILWLLALSNLLAGNLAALAQKNLKRMLAWSSVGQMGYVALALVAAHAGGARAAAFYLVVYATAGMAAFGVVSVISDEDGFDAIEAYRGLGYRNPLAGAVLAVAMFSLAGIPPAAGFMGKFAVFAAALRGGEFGLALVGMLSALVAVFFYLRVVVVMYMKSSDAPLVVVPVRRLNIVEAAALLIPAFVLVLLGVYPQPLLELLEKIII